MEDPGSILLPRGIVCWCVLFHKSSAVANVAEVMRPSWVFLLLPTAVCVFSGDIQQPMAPLRRLQVSINWSAVCLLVPRRRPVKLFCFPGRSFKCVPWYGFAWWPKMSHLKVLVIGISKENSRAAFEKLVPEGLRSCTIKKAQMAAVIHQLWRGSFLSMGNKTVLLIRNHAY